MCGIFAILNSQKDSQYICQSTLKYGTKIRHRGPDKATMFQWATLSDGILKGNCLMHHRLSIVDPENGNQPFTTLDNNIQVIINGEIYNYKELAKTFPEFPFQTQCDGEIILPLYEKYGEHFLDYIDGIFSFILIDINKNYFFIARDPIGVTSLYWGSDPDGTVYISSEIKGLEGLCSSYREFLPGTCLSSHTGYRNWYNPFWVRIDTCPSLVLPFDSSKIRCLLQEAVIKRLMSDVPYGLLLSGGLDSSIVASIVVRHLSKLNNGVLPPVYAFSIGTKGSTDVVYAKQVADFLGIEYHEFSFTIDEGIGAIEDVIYHTETYDITTIRASVPMFFIAKHLKKMEIKMVLSGEGSDEIFGGYLYFHKAPSPEEFYSETRRKIGMLSKYDCLRANKSMASHGVEVRCPYLDKAFVDYCMRIDPSVKMITQGRMEKYILREAFNDEKEPWLPKSVLWRQKEQFSDGVGYSWIDSIKAYTEKMVTNEMMENAYKLYPYNTPTTKEGYYYRNIFHRFFPSPCASELLPQGPSIACSSAVAIRWDKEWVTRADPSGRSILDCHINPSSKI